MSEFEAFRTCVPSLNRIGELLYRAADVTQARERAPGSFTGIPLKTRQTLAHLVGLLQRMV
jgi:hypothetical protein